MDTVNAKFHRKLLGGLHERILEEVFGSEGVLRGPALIGVVLEQFADEIHCMIRHPAGVRNALLEILTKLVGEDHVTALRLILLPQRTHLVNGRPGLGGGVAQHPEDEIQLGWVARSLQEGTSTEHLSNDASNTPHIDLGRVDLATQQELRGAVPKRNDLVREPLHLGIPGPGQAPVSNLELALPVDEKVRRLEIAVDNPVGVHVVHAREELLGPGLDMILRQTNVGRLQNAGKVVFRIFEHHEHILRDLSSLCDVANTR